VKQYKCSNRSKHFSNRRSHLQVEVEPQVEELLEAEEVPLEVVVMLLEAEMYPLNNQHKLRHNHRPLMAH
jgi:hypothetical protein